MKKIPLTKNIRLTLLALLFILTPNVNMVDILPDFIGYFILLRTFMPLSDRIPYFDAVTSYVKRLMYLSLLRIPAFILMGMIKGENYTGNDQTALFTLIFAAAEATLTLYLIINLYQAFSYLCERGGYRADGNAPV